LPDNSVDAVITDVPYGTTACAWDTVIPFAPMWDMVERVMKPRGAFVTTASQPFTSALIMSRRAWFRYCWVWEKSLATGYLNANRAPMKAHEDIAVFSAHGHVFNPQKEHGKPYCATSGAVGDVVRDKTVGGYTTVNGGDRFPRSVLRFNSAANPVHGTQKPVDLFAYLVRTYTNPGDTVLDFCMGSGTTGVACAQTGRSFIGCEISPEYFAVAEARIAAARQVQTLPFVEAAK
jgi:hypothetical protein